MGDLSDPSVFSQRSTAWCCNVLHISPENLGELSLQVGTVDVSFVDPLSQKVSYKDTRLQELRYEGLWEACQARSSKEQQHPKAVPSRN